MIYKGGKNMLSGQMIYTACGKDKSGAFSVWSKSDSITKEECTEIIKLMTYNRPRNAPYMPTPEDIVKFFPPKYAFFGLSSGKLCVAKTSYIGDVYSVEDAYGGRDTRSGNFLIHAYVFASLDKDANPFGLFNLTFKNKLEYTEWHDMPVPDSLPEVPIQINQMVNESEVQQLISNDKEFFVSLVQALVNSCKDDKVIIFSDEEETIRSYYRAISLLVPQKLYKNLTFSNQYYPQAEYTLISLGMPPVKIRNISDDFLLTAFNYQQAVNEGKYVFNKGKGICSTLTPERYLADIMLSVEQSGLYAATKKVDSVNKIMEDLNCDENTAIRVFNLMAANFSWFESFEEFTDTFNYVCEHNYIDNRLFAPIVWEKVIQTKRWGEGSKVAFLIKYVYENAEMDIKQAIMRDYIQNFECFGVSRTLDEKAFLSDVKNKAPFIWNDFVNYSISSNYWEHSCASHALFSISYMYFSMAAPNAMNNSAAESVLINLLKKTLINRNLTELEKYIEIINTNGQDYRKRLWDMVVLPLSKQPLQGEANIEFFFALMRLTNDIEQRNSMFENMIAINGNSQSFMPVYVRCFDSNKAMLSSIERELQEKGSYEAFFMSKEAYGFKIATQVNSRMLSDYFERFYKPGYDQGAYLAKIKPYLSSQTSKMKVYEALKQYSIIKELQDGFKDLLQIIQVIEMEIYSVNIQDLLSVSKEQLSLIGEIDLRLKKNACRTSGLYEILLVALTLTGKNGRDKRLSTVTDKAVYANMNNVQLSYISEHFMEHLLALYLDAKKQLKLDYKQLIATIIIPIINVKEFERDFIGVISNSGNYIEIVADVIAYAHNNQTNAAISLKKIMGKYVDSMQRSEYKSLFKKLGDYISSDDMVEVQKYIDEFMATHKGFFESLFAKKKTK